MARKPRDPAWIPTGYDIADVMAVKAVSAGDATPDQQRRAMAWIILRAAQAYDLSFRSDGDGGDRETAFAEGRRFVGMQIVKLQNLSRETVAAMVDAERNRNV